MKNQTEKEVNTATANVWREWKSGLSNPQKTSELFSIAK